MNTNPPIHDSELDRLVDGELDGPALRALVARLEADPAGWRRCALAFLEAQGWHRALAAAGKPSATSWDPDFDRLPASKGRRRPSALVTAAIAASTLVAGFGAGRFLASGGPGSAEAVAIADGDPFTLPPPPVATPAPPAVPTHEVGVLRLASTTPSGQPVSVPVLAGPGLDERWLRSQPSFVPDSVREQLEDRGYTVERQRRLISVQMDDSGRYLSIPVDEVQLLPPSESI